MVKLLYSFRREKCYSLFLEFVSLLQSCRPFRPLKYIEIVKMFVDAFDKVVAQRKTSPNSGGNDLNQLPKSYLVRTFVGLLTHFENNQKLEVDYGPKRKRFKRVPRVREYKGHQLVEKSHSPQYSCACQRKKVDDFVSCTCKLKFQQSHLIVI